MEALYQYKYDLCNISKSHYKIIKDLFTRWYINTKKTKDGINLEKNVINKKDLAFCNLYYKSNIDIVYFMKKSLIAFKKYQVAYKKNQVAFKKLNYDDSKVKPDYSVIVPKQLNRLKSIYKGNAFETDTAQLIEIYKFLGINNMHLSIPPIFKGIELFGSPMNTHNNEFCSPFQIEKLFGSQGSFFEYKFPKSELYLCNPPFDEELIKQMSKYILKYLEHSKNELTFLVTIPVWDSESQKKIEIRDFGMEFEGFSLLEESKYCKEHEILNKDEYPYYDYYKDKYSPASWTHLLILANYDTEHKLNDFILKWHNAVASHKTKKL